MMTILRSIYVHLRIIFRIDISQQGKRPMTTTPAAMDWDLTSYFAEFDGPAMRQFKDELQRDIATAREQAAALAPLAEDNADTWEGRIPPD